VEMTKILPQVPTDRLVFGNIDPAGIIKNSSKEIIKSKALELLENTSSYKNFILSSGCDIPPGTPLSNIDAFFEALEIFNNSLKPPRV
jgi:uroporphyrinogen decarboxylase